MKLTNNINHDLQDEIVSSREKYSMIELQLDDKERFI